MACSDKSATALRLPFPEFMTRLLKLRGSNTATVKAREAVHSTVSTELFGTRGAHGGTYCQDLVDLRKWISCLEAMGHDVQQPAGPQAVGA